MLFGDHSVTGFGYTECDGQTDTFNFKNISK